MRLESWVHMQSIKMHKESDPLVKGPLRAIYIGLGTFGKIKKEDESNEERRNM